MAPARRREPLGRHAGGGREGPVIIQVPAQGAVAQVVDERRRGTGVVAPEDEMNGTGAVLWHAPSRTRPSSDRAWEGSAGPGRANGSTIALYGRCSSMMLRATLAVVPDAAEADPPGVEAPVLRECRRRYQETGQCRDEEKRAVGGASHRCHSVQLSRSAGEFITGDSGLAGCQA